MLFDDFDRFPKLLGWCFNTRPAYADKHGPFGFCTMQEDINGTWYTPDSLDIWQPIPKCELFRRIQWTSDLIPKITIHTTWMDQNRRTTQLVARSRLWSWNRSWWKASSASLVVQKYLRQRSERSIKQLKMPIAEISLNSVSTHIPDQRSRRFISSVTTQSRS